METSFAPGDAVDNDDGRFPANIAGRHFGFRFHTGSIRHRIRDGKMRLRRV